LGQTPLKCGTVGPRFGTQDGKIVAPIFMASHCSAQLMGPNLEWSASSRMWIIAGPQTLAEASGSLKAAPQTLQNQTLKPSCKNDRIFDADH